MTNLVTGATGYLGGAVARALVRRGEPVRVLVRDPRRAARLEGVEAVSGDVLDPTAVRAALSGARRLFHLAALVRTWSPDRALFHRVNVDATRELVRAAARSGVERIVVTSSFLALGTDAARNPYAASKRAALAAVEEEARAGAPVVVVVPGVVYGPGERTEGSLMTRMLADLLAGRLRALPGSGRQVWSFAWIEDVAEGHLAAAARGRPGVRYALGGENRTLDAFVADFAAAAGVAPPRRHVPRALLRLAGALGEGAARLTGRAPPLTRDVADLLCASWPLDPGDAARELGYRATASAEAIRRTLAWLRS